MSNEIGFKFGHKVVNGTASDDGVARLPFSDHHNPNEAPRLPSPNHGDVACLYASVSILLDMGGARLIRDWGATKILSKWTP